MTLIQTAPKKIYIWVEDPSIWDYATQTVSGNGNNKSYFYGVCITANKNCSITGISFLGGYAYVGTLRIAQGTLAQYSGTEYNVTADNNPNGIYLLPTPYQLTANTKYVISFKLDSGDASYNDVMTYPVSGTNVTFNHGTYSDSANWFSQYCYRIAGVGTLDA